MGNKKFLCTIIVLFSSVFAYAVSEKTTVFFRENYGTAAGGAILGVFAAHTCYRKISMRYSCCNCKKESTWYEATEDAFPLNFSTKTNACIILLVAPLAMGSFLGINHCIGENFQFLNKNVKRHMWQCTQTSSAMLLVPFVVNIILARANK